MSNAQKPSTISELLEFCNSKGLQLRKMRFFIGEDYPEPKAFGIYQAADGDFVVYKNKADGSRAVRYKGPDEAHAVGEIYNKIGEEIAKRKPPRRGNVPRQAGDQTMPVFSSQSHVSKTQAARKKKNNAFSLFLIFVMILAAAVIIIRNINDQNKPKRGYYKRNNSYYYYDSDDWYVYGTAWDLAESGELDFIDDAGDYYVSEYYDAGYDIGNFMYSDYYDGYYERSTDYDDDDDDDWDFDWDDWDDWDVGDTDWDTDW